MSSLRSENIYVGKAEGFYEPGKFRDLVNNISKKLNSPYNEEEIRTKNPIVDRTIYHFFNDGFGIEHVFFEQTGLCGIIVTFRKFGKESAYKVIDLIRNKHN